MDEESLDKWQQLQHCKSIIPLDFTENDYGLTFVLVTLYHVLRSVSSEAIIRVGGTKYHIWCSFLEV